MESKKNKTLIVTGRRAMDHFRMAQVIGSLSIEVRTGMRHSRGSVLKLAQERYGIKARTKKAALEEMKKLYHDTWGWNYGD